MLQLFRNNQSTTVFLLALYVALLRLPAMLGWLSPPVGPGEALGGLLFRDVFGWADGNTQLSAIGAAVLVFIQALLVNRLVDTYRMMDDRNWLPGMFYALAASAVPDFHFITPELVGITFVPIALMRLFQVYKQSLAYSGIFDGAFWTTIGVLFYPPAVWFLPVAYFALFNLRSFPAREQLVFLTGILAPSFLALTGYFWFDQGGAFINTQLSRWVFIPGFHWPNDLYSSLKTALLGLFIALNLVGFNLFYHKRLIQIQKYITILYWFMFAGLAATFFQSTVRSGPFLLLMPTTGIFLAYWFQATRNTALLEIFHFTLLAVIFFIQFFPH